MQPDLRKVREMLRIYIQALPIGCSFSIVSFGSITPKYPLGYVIQMFNNEYENGIFPVTKNGHEKIKLLLEDFLKDMMMDMKGTHLAEPLRQCY
jgi:hypothetical protein